MRHRDDVPDLLALEAMASALPLVATATAGTTEAVARGGTGVIVAPGDAAASAAVHPVLEARPFAVRLGEQGVRRARDRCSAAAAASATVAVYDPPLA